MATKQKSIHEVITHAIRISFIAGICIPLTSLSSAHGEENKPFEITTPPLCMNYKNEKVQFINTDKGR